MGAGARVWLWWAANLPFIIYNVILVTIRASSPAENDFSASKASQKCSRGWLGPEDSFPSFPRRTRNASGTNYFFLIIKKLTLTWFPVLVFLFVPGTPNPVACLPCLFQSFCLSQFIPYVMDFQYWSCKSWVSVLVLDKQGNPSLLDLHNGMDDTWVCRPCFTTRQFSLEYSRFILIVQIWVYLRNLSGNAEHHLEWWLSSWAEVTRTNLRYFEEVVSCNGGDFYKESSMFVTVKVVPQYVRGVAFKQLDRDGCRRRT